MPSSILKVDDDHWMVDGENIRYSDSFGHTGWYWDQTGDYVFPPTKNNFLEVLEEVLNESNRGPDVQARPAG